MRADALINELKTNPTQFNEKGQAYDLLQKYFKGLDLHTIRPLLLAENPLVVREAIWIVSELGDKSYSLLDEVIYIHKNFDVNILYCSLESIANGSILDRKDCYVFIVLALESEFKVIRLLAMQLISNAEKAQIYESMKKLMLEHTSSSRFVKFLDSLLKYESLTSTAILNMILSGDDLTRKCGAVIAKKVIHNHPEIIVSQISSTDDDIKQFAEWTKEIYID